MQSATPLVSICCITYNHENYITQAIDYFLIQKTDFQIEIIIHDDASTDHTTEIIREYQQRFPNLIRLIIQTENQFKTRKFGFLSDLFKQAQGKYIALCEGDDYWTDPYKLQKQVDFLEANPDFSISFHNVQIINEDFANYNTIQHKAMVEEITTIDNLLNGVNYIATVSVMFKASSIKKLPEWFNSLPFADYALNLIAARSGKIKYINEIMATYRIHSNGIHGHLGNSLIGRVVSYQQECRFWQIIHSSQIFPLEKTNNALSTAINNLVNLTEILNVELLNLKAQIQGMESSFFWRLRNRWYDFRRTIKFF